MEEKRSIAGRIDPSWATLLIRLALGIVFIAHGSMKIFGAFGGHGMSGLIVGVGAMGFKPPILWAWLAALAEFGGGLGVLFGLLTRLAAFGIAFDMGVAILFVHAKNGFFLPKGFEFAFVLLMMAVSLMLSGAGKYSLDWYTKEMLRRKAQSS